MPRWSYYLERRYLARFSPSLGEAVARALDRDLERALGYELPPAAPAPMPPRRGG